MLILFSVLMTRLLFLDPEGMIYPIGMISLILLTTLRSLPSVSSLFSIKNIWCRLSSSLDVVLGALLDVVLSALSVVVTSDNLVGMFLKSSSGGSLWFCFFLLTEFRALSDKVGFSKIEYLSALLPEFKKVIFFFCIACFTCIIKYLINGL